MSFRRLVYYSAVIGGWAALLGWGLAELLALIFGLGEGGRHTAIVACFVGAAIGAGITVVGEISQWQWKRILRRAGLGAVGGGLLGCLGGLFGHALFSGIMNVVEGEGAFANILGAFVRALGWTLMGAGVGLVCGLADFSLRRLKNGLIGGVVGGFLGGILFDPFAALVAGSRQGADLDVSARATGFVILGICVGLFIGLVQVLLRQAWLTVVDGYGPGRQVILDRPLTMLGRADHLPLSFIGPANRDLDPEHAQVMRSPNGVFQLEDKGSNLGTYVNHQPLKGLHVLRDGDVIKIGRNLVRFNMRTGGKVLAEGETSERTKVPQTDKPIAPAPLPPKPRSSTAAGKSAVSPPKQSAPKTSVPQKPVGKKPVRQKSADPSTKLGGANIPKPPPPPAKK